MGTQYCSLVVIGKSKRKLLLDIRKFIYENDRDAFVCHSTVRSLFDYGFARFHIKFRSDEKRDQFIHDDMIMALQNTLNGTNSTRAEQKKRNGTQYLASDQCMVFGLESMPPYSYSEDDPTLLYLAKTQWEDVDGAFLSRTHRMKNSFSVTQHDGYIDGNYFVQRWRLLAIDPTILSSIDNVKKQLGKDMDEGGKVLDVRESKISEKEHLAIKPEDFRKGRPSQGKYGYALICADGYTGQIDDYLSILTKCIPGFDLRQDSIRDIGGTTTMIVGFTYSGEDVNAQAKDIGKAIRRKKNDYEQKMLKSGHNLENIEQRELHFLGIIDGGEVEGQAKGGESWEFYLTQENASAGSFYECLRDAFGNDDCDMDFVQMDGYSKENGNSIVRFGVILHGDSAKDGDIKKRLIEKCGESGWKYEENEDARVPDALL